MDFAARMFGPKAHQASAGFYHWCYEANPNCKDGRGGAVIARTDSGRVVGMVNRLFLTWDVNGTLVRIPAIGDLALDPDSRKGGLGLRLVLQATRDVEHAFVNGSNPNSSPLFRGLKYQEITDVFWGRRVIHPLRMFRRLAMHRMFGTTAGPHTLFRSSGRNGFHANADPDDDLLQALCDHLNDAPGKAKLHWTAETLRWRFFHPMGPRHVLFHRPGDKGALQDAVLLSAGLRHGIQVCRPIAYRCTGVDAFREMLRVVIDECRAHGIDLLAAFTIDKNEARLLQAVGSRRQDPGPATFFYHKRKMDAEMFRGAAIQGAASDLGLESIAG